MKLLRTIGSTPASRSRLPGLAHFADPFRAVAVSIVLLGLLSMRPASVGAWGEKENTASEENKSADAPAPTTDGTASLMHIPQDLSEIGTLLDEARQTPPIEPGHLQRLLESLVEMRKDLDDSHQAAARLLGGEILYDLGRFAEAEKEFEAARKKWDKSVFADDAEAARIRAIESQGRDQDAAKEWLKWEKRFKNSRFLPEVRLARTWNAIRRSELKEATALGHELVLAFPWMEEDPRVTLALATIAYLDGRPEEALLQLTDRNESASAIYLRALCHQDQGVMLKAAARFQEVAERYSDSPLRDRALLAKANTFLSSRAYRSAADEFARVVDLAADPAIRAEAALRRGVSDYFAGDSDDAVVQLRSVVGLYHETDVAARAQYMLGEFLYAQGMYEEAIPEFNRVLTHYFEHELAATAQYRVGRCLDALDRRVESTGAYQAVVSGYSLSKESPAAAYLAGVGLLDQGLPQAAAPYFQLVLDRYAREDGTGELVFAQPEHQELVEAALCLLQVSYHRTGNMGQLSGVPHMMIAKMPPSNSPWRAYALLIDADAMAAQSRFKEAEATLTSLIQEFPAHSVSVSANRLLAWTYAQQGQNDLAISTEEKMLAKYAAQGDKAMSSAFLNKAHVLFNRKDYEKAAAAYEEFLQLFPEHEESLLALYQAGLSQQRLGNSGNAVDSWEQLVARNPASEIAEKAWVRAGDVYFQAGHYEEAKRCYEGLLEHFSTSGASAMGMLRIAQCAYNAGDHREALGRYSAVIGRFPGTPYAAEAERGLESTLYRLGQQSDGNEVLAELIERYPTSSFAGEAQFMISTRLYEAEKYAEAAEAFRRVVSQFPGYSQADQAHYLMGDSYSRAAMPEEALNAYEQFLVFFPDSELRPTVQFNLGSIRFDNEDYMRAAVDFTGVLEADSTGEMAGPALFNLSLCHVMLGDNAEAWSSLERYRSRYPDDERSHEIAYQLGDLHEQAGRFEDAVKEFRLALEDAKEADRVLELQYRIGSCQEGLGDQDAALTSYRKTLKAKDKSNAFRLSALARCAALYEKAEKWEEAMTIYRDLAAHAKDEALAQAAKERADELELVAKK